MLYACDAAFVDLLRLLLLPCVVLVVFGNFAGGDFWDVAGSMLVVVGWFAGCNFLVLSMLRLPDLDVVVRGDLGAWTDSCGDAP